MRQELVGRDPELAVLAGCLTAAMAGRPQVAMCRGEPGIGKTRLADELVARATALGALCAWGLASDAEGAPPSWPWRQVLGALAGSVDLPAMAREGGLEADLGPLAPDLFAAAESTSASASASTLGRPSGPASTLGRPSGPASTLGRPSGPAFAASPEDRFRQFEAVSRLLREVSRGRPLVIVLDDLHWADTSTLLLLRHLARSLGDDRLLVVANTRPTDQRHSELLSRIAREPVTTVLELGGLGEGAIRQQLAGLLEDGVDDATAAQVRSLTGGNPFFVREVGRAMADARAGRRFSLVTPTVRDAIGERLGQLSEECVRLLRAAAVVGPAFSVPLVAEASGIDVLQALELAGEAAAAGLVEQDDAPRTFRFVHALVRDAIESDLSPAEVVRLHRRTAEAIDRLHGPALGPRLFDVARHWAHGAVEGEGVIAAGWLARAGEEAMRQLAYEEAARLFRQAVDVGGPELGDEERCRLLVAAGRAMNLSGDLTGRREACLAAAEAARRLNRPDLVADAALVLKATGDIRIDLTTRQMCEEALGALDSQSTALRAQVMARFVETFVFMRHDEAVAAAGTEALALAEASGDDAALAAALRARQVVSVGPDGLDERAALARRMLALGTDRRDAQLQLWAHQWNVDVGLERGDLGAVARSIEALAECARQVRGPLARFEVARCRAVLAQAQGRFPDARRLEAEAFAILAPTDHAVRFTFRSALLANVSYHTGPDPVDTGAIEYEGASEGHLEVLAFMGQVAMAFALAVEGRLDEARSVYRSLGPVGGWEVPPHVELVGPVFALLVAVALDDPADIAALHERLSHHRGHHVASGMTAMNYFGPIELWLGVAARHLGRFDDAVADLRHAERACAENG
ncbi:MAG TPA: AAA family ATPase, partial [Acidimicrobiales bacterium]|nr:AAA family ATPase [Acidimicrobiales bacterium]